MSGEPDEEALPYCVTLVKFVPLLVSLTLPVAQGQMLLSTYPGLVV